MKKKRFNAITIILIILLGVRLVGQIVTAIMSLLSADMLSNIIFFIFAILYLAALIGVAVKQKWGSILALGIAIIDILVVFYIGGAAGIGAGIIDLALLFFAYEEYKQL